MKKNIIRTILICALFPLSYCLLFSAQKLHGENTITEKRIPTVSIITSVFDPDNLFMEQFLYDITRQTIFADCELILIQPPHSGDAQGIIEEYMKKYSNIRYIKIEYDPGLYAVWNMGIRLARGEFITNANIDDRRNPSCLEIHAQTLRQDPSIDLVYSDDYIAYAPNTLFEDQHTDNIRRIAEFSQKLMYLPLPGPMPLWRKSAHARCGYFIEYFSSSASLEMWNRMVSRGMKFKKIPGLSGVYYLNPKGVSTDKAVEKVNKRKKEDAIIVCLYSYLWK